MRKLLSRLLLSMFVATTSALAVQAQQNKLGIFEDHGDVGLVDHKGSVEYNEAEKSYTIAGGGENMWANTDAFHFLWKKASGNLSIAADISFVGTGGNAHRKACLLIRQTLDPGSPYADAATHGDGLTSIQYRDEKDGVSREIQSNISKPARVRIEKVGNYVSMSIANAGEEMKPAGGAFRIMLEEPFYIGLGVCAHDNKVLEKAIFKNVEIKTITAPPPTGGLIESTLEVVPIANGDRRVVYHRISRARFEAPNWSKEGNLVFNDGGSLFSIPWQGGKEPVKINTGTLNKLNNDHGISPDGKMIAISDGTRPGGSRVYVLPYEGGEPKLLTEKAPSYWHGWAPDSKSLVYCAQRDGNYDVYSMSVDGGEEKRLTTAEGLDDGPEYSPDGKYIYFNSVRSGTMQIWRMKPDGSDQEQVTKDEYNNWFAHPSPNGRWLVFISYNLKDVAVGDHPANKDVMLRLMRTDSIGAANGGTITVLAKLFGGQGTNNVPSWSPDSARIAFVSYRLVPQEN